MLTAEVIGNLGADAIIKDFNGKHYVSFSVAHSKYSKDGNGNKSEATQWISVLWYGEGGKVFPYLKKGTKVFVHGNEDIRMYFDRSNNPQVSITIDASEVFLCGTKQNNE